nr:ankyrin repeat domain-containing protein [Bryobacter sp.]
YGSTWAALALLETMPKKQTVPRATLPADPEWARLAAFGSLDELRRRLDSGLDPNSATAEGTSLLMFAIADEAKVKLLLSRGAKAAHKAKSGYTPLIAAAVNRSGVDVMKMLVAKGAEVNPGPGTRNNATPLNYAVATGDESAVRFLLDNGADPRKKTLLAGVVPVDPITNATGYEHTALIRLLVERGVDINEKDKDGMTQLAWAFLFQKPDLVRTLLSLGATRDGKDKFGLAPADHVKGIEYPAAAILQLARQ